MSASDQTDLSAAEHSAAMEAIRVTATAAINHNGELEPDDIRVFVINALVAALAHWHRREVIYDERRAGSLGQQVTDRARAVARITGHAA